MMRFSFKTDIKYTFRQLAKSPGFMMLSTLVLAGGLSLCLYIFTFIYTIGFKPIELPSGERIVEICGESRFGSCVPLKAFEFASIRDDITTLENIGIYQDFSVYMKTEDLYLETTGVRTEWNMLQLAEHGALHGRTLLEADQLPDAEPVAVLSFNFWQLAFDGDPNVIGSYVELDGVLTELTQIVGIMPEGFTFPRWTDLWVPAGPDLIDPAVNDMTPMRPFALLKPDVPVSAATNEISNLLGRMRQQFPIESRAQDSINQRLLNSVDSGFVTTLPQRNMHDLGNQLAFGILGMLALMLFLLACINIGTLLLARTNERMKDVSIRVALGAPRMRLLVQCMGESIVIAIVGTVLAVLLSGLLLEGMNVFLNATLGDEGLEFWWDFRIQEFTLLVALLFATLTVLATSAWPAWKLINGDFNSVMRDGTRGAVGLHTSRFSKVLVVVAIALISIVLYSFIATMTVLWSIASTARLVDPEGIYSVEISTMSQFNSGEERLQFYQSIQERLRNNPDVTEVFMLGLTGYRSFELAGVDYLSQQDKPVAPVQVYSGDIDFIGANLLEGRLLNEGDNENSVRVALVSRSMAQQLWPDQSSIGQSLNIAVDEFGESFEPFTVVGMVSDSPVDSNDIFRQEHEMIYLPLGQMDSGQITAIVSSTSPPQAVTGLLGETVLSLNSGVSINIVSWVEDRQLISFVTLSAVLTFTAIGVFAFLISLAGIFGLTKNSILLRLQEIGTQRALGATDSRIGQSFINQGARQVIIGVLIAVVVCAPFSYFVYSLAGPDYVMPGVVTSAIAFVFFFACILLAIYYPVRSALQSEPAELLRYQ